MLVLTLVAVVVQEVIADNATSTASVTNVVPVSSAVSIDGGAASITLTENTTKNVVVTATVTDNNGCEDIDSVSVKFFRTDLTSTGADDSNHRYTQAATLVGGTCTAGGSDLSANYTATIAVQYYADPTDAGSANEATDWSAEVTPADGSGGTAGANDTIEMATLTALNVTADIAYGELALSADTGTTDKTSTITNTGNESIGVQVDGYEGDGAHTGTDTSMSCTIGTIPIGNEKYSTTTAVDWDTKDALTHTAATVTGFTVAQRTDGVTTDDIYWGFGMPANGVSGDCKGTIVFTVI